jgi:plasmid maintenance system antidote protein VapI
MKAQFGREWLQEEYGEKHRSMRDMAKECGVSRETIRVALKDCGIEYVSPRERIDIARVRKQIEGRGKSYRAVARELGVSHGMIARLCQENGIQRRNGAYGKTKAPLAGHPLASHQTIE